jgi:beta-barrel assembly-enhancing protease
LKARRRIVFLLLLTFLVPNTLSALTLSEEKKYGREVFVDIVTSTALYQDPVVDLYLEDVRRRLEIVAALPFPVALTLIQSSEANAFATIGGYVYMTSGLIAMVEKEEELAGVLAHEMAHIGKRHIAKRLEKQKYINAAMLGTMILSALIGGSAGKSAVLAAGMGAAQAVSLKYSREDEEEADRVGTATAEKAGYGGTGIAEFLKKMRLTGVEKSIPQYLLTHPYPDERIKRIEGLFTENRVTVDTSFFPYLVARAAVLQGSSKSGAQEAALARYERDPRNPVFAYGASLVFLSKGQPDVALSTIRTVTSPFKNQLLGEILFNARRFQEAIEALRDETSPVSRFFLAKSYEGAGGLDMALKTLVDLAGYGSAFPEIFYRMGMIAGRMGLEATGYEFLGRYYVQIGRNDLAKINLEKAISRYGINAPQSRELLELLDQVKA